MRKLMVAVTLTSFLTAGVALAAEGQGKPPQWASLAQQLRDAHAPHGSALEALIMQHQDFSKLDPGEASDRRQNIPAWLRVYWREAHPELQCRKVGDDPTYGGCYPLVLHEILEWMISHPNFDNSTGQGEDEFEGKTLSAGANVRLSGAQSAPRSESDIRVNYWNPSLIIGASNNISSSGQQAQWYSTDGGATWNQNNLSLQTGDAFMSDPTVDWTSDGTAWSTTIGINSAGTILKMRAYKSTNNGATWTHDGIFSGSQTSADKQMMWVDHSASSPYKDNIYAIYHNGNPVYLGRRTGGAWQAPLLLSGSETTGTGIGADIKSNSFGDVFGMWPDTGSKRIYVVKSTNGGASWSGRTIVASTYGSFQIAIPADASRQVLVGSVVGTYRTASKNNVYVVWNDLSGDSGCTSGGGPGTNASSTCKTRLFFSRSTDGGTTWSAKVKINNQAGLNDQFFPWMVVDETNGKIGVTYYDTVGDSTRTSVNVYYQSSSDDGVTWTTPLKVTTASTNETTSGADSGNQFGDYTSLSGINGTFWPSWTDRRSGAKEEVWSAKIIDDGGSCTPPAAPTGVTASSSSQTSASVSWAAASGATSYTISRSTTSGSGYASVGTSTSTSFTDNSVSCGTTYYYVVSASNGTCSSANSAQAPATTSACTGGALYDATLKAPKCGSVGNTCDTGASLVLGRNALGPEPNQPNTINNSCADGASGSFHGDESNDRLKVYTTDGTNFAAGKQVRVEATVWAYSTFSSDHLDLYYAANANSPTWTLIATVNPTVAGAQVLSASYTLPSGSLQAVRANFRYNGSASSCSTGAYDDRDDLVFAVTAAANNPPTANFTFTTSTLTASFTDTSTDSDGTIASRAWNFGDGGTSTATNPSHTYAAAGTYTVSLTVTDNLGATGSTSKSVTVTSGPSCTTYSGTLSSPNSAIQPNGTYYQSTLSGSHTGHLVGPTGADFDLYFYKWNGSSWTNVASATTASNVEDINYSGTSGYYYWRVYAYSGSGSYTLCIAHP